MTKKEVLDYVMNTPGNTNRAVLSGMLDSFEKGDNKEEIELSATENKVYTPETGKVYKKVTVNVPAPPSDVTTATVTAVYGGNDVDINYLAIPTIADDVISINEITEGTFTVPLYKGVMKIGTTSEATSGDCEKVGDYIIITGDCTITVK